MTRPLRALASASIGVLFALTLSACARDSVSPVELTSQDSGGQQAIAIGQQLRISLDSNPSTGYRWAVDGAIPAALEQSGEARYTGGGSDALGASGTETWTFVGKSVGAGTLKLKYWRSFEPTATPENTFEISVDVR